MWSGNTQRLCFEVDSSAFTPPFCFSVFSFFSLLSFHFPVEEQEQTSAEKAFSRRLQLTSYGEAPLCVETPRLRLFRDLLTR